jgi:hypothetical protein
MEASVTELHDGKVILQCGQRNSTTGQYQGIGKAFFPSTMEGEFLAVSSSQSKLIRRNKFSRQGACVLEIHRY